MSFVQGSAIEKASKGSIEERVSLVHEHLHSKFVEGINIVSTFEDHVLAFDCDKKLLKIEYKIEDDGTVTSMPPKKSKSIPVIENEDVPAHVAKELKSVSKRMLSGKAPMRTQVREMASMIKKDEMYWMSDILSKIEESCSDADWSKMYEANLERIRTTLHGNIRMIEGQVPKTHYTRIAKEKLVEFDKELRESMGILSGNFTTASEDCQALSFSEKQDFLSAVRVSLIDEAQAVVSLLGKAVKLAGRDDLPQVAIAHDKLANRARNMALVSAYIKGKAQPTDKE